MSATPPGYRPPHPFLYFLLFLPFGATSIFISVTIGTLASHAHISDEVIAGMIAMNILPHTWKVFWAPAVDTLWNPRGWYITTNLISSAAIITMGFVPISDDTVPIITALIFVNGLATTFVGMCTESLMSRLTPPEGRGAAGGWSQAGNVGGGVIGGLGLQLSEVLIDWVPFLIVGGLLLCCSLVLLLVKEPPQTEPRPKFGAAMKALFRDLGGLLIDPKRSGKLPSKVWLAFPPVFLFALTGAGILAITLSLMPIGSGGAQNLFGAMGAQWGAGDGLISWTNGIISGFAAIGGSLAGGWLSDHMDKRKAYAVSGVVLALFAFLFAVMPQNPPSYVVGVVLYNAGLGMCYASFTAFVLDVIGHTGGATKYNLFASLANLPIYVMGLVDGWIATKHGRLTMLWVDGAAGIGGAVVLLAVVWLVRLRRSNPHQAELPRATVKRSQ